MTRTKSMYINESIEAEELYLFSINESVLYPMFTAICDNLLKKVNKGIYDHEKAINAFYPFATVASKLYKKYFGSKEWSSFTVNERFNAAVLLVDAFESDNDIEI